MKILVIDNYDSFVYNIVHILRNEASVEVDVIYNDQINIPAINHYDKILLSPGPGIPKEAGQLMEVIERFASEKPILGVCLGHQAIAEYFGGNLTNLKQPLHGVQSTLSITKEDYLFKDIPPSFQIGHYHSWVVNPNDLNELEVTATDSDNNIMAIRHPHFDIRGVQFHPESILTEYGKKLLQNWVNN
ncbi:anthranilate synthase component II [Parvicella tangerina]|uniref:Aminodeoxychorismate/anthranilate synthase component 2 n=1 Tax=Parvicella tangerina TaxID=2829795 RepID=A0A916JNJ2_9FLAO|nr:aminodeoxychorismate/anthranilate synthase component II [Parvicella tangerina]CAG5083904.1 Aminodeoxychorismate/anthranilate synthase component 2 [Parvicella tangerina]